MSNITLYEGYSEFGNVRDTLCGMPNVTKIDADDDASDVSKVVVVSKGNAMAVNFAKAKGGSESFRAKWRKVQGKQRNA